MPSRRERVGGGFTGHLVADALGVPYEGREAHELPPPERLDMTPPFGFARSHADVPPGTWSDDGSMFLCLLASLLERNGAFNPDDFGGRLVAWKRDGYLAVDGRVFDVGLQTATAISRIAAGTPASGAGTTDVAGNGAGALLRALAVALAARGDDRALVDVSHRQSRVTHAHPVSETCCAFYALWARRTLDGAADPWAEAAATLRRLYVSDPTRAKVIEEEIRPEEFVAGCGSSYAVDALRSARWAVAQGPYETAVRSAVACGGDTDAVASLAGGVAGLRDGLAAIPHRWIDALRGRALCEPLLARLLNEPALTGESARG
ncbi:MAG TPA: ADP-ribosylglycohydrolase family protein [Planctomycetota bacterium]|nr:ADP-ribosylglycohydrolase family protein [Planctomycetota bacterium]